MGWVSVGFLFDPSACLGFGKWMGFERAGLRVENDGLYQRGGRREGIGGKEGRQGRGERSGPGGDSRYGCTGGVPSGLRDLDLLPLAPHTKIRRRMKKKT